MSQHIAHYLFGELEKVNTTRVVPSIEKALKQHLDRWLPQMIESAQEAEPDSDKCRRLCDDWQERVETSDLGVISLPVADAPGTPPPYEPYEHLICRVWFNWATGGRVSRTGHAILLSREAWERLDFNPFQIPIEVHGAREFADLRRLDLPGSLDDLEDMRGKSHKRLQDLVVSTNTGPLEKVLCDRPPLLLPAASGQSLYEILLLLLAPRVRQRRRCWTGRFGIRSPFREAFDLGRADDGLSQSTGRQALMETELGAQLLELQRGGCPTRRDIEKWPFEPEAAVDLWGFIGSLGEAVPATTLPLTESPTEKPMAPPPTSPPLPPAATAREEQPAEVPEPSPNRRSRSHLWAAVVLLLLLAGYLGLRSVRERGRNASFETWVEQVRQGHAEQSIELIREGLEWIKNPPTDSEAQVRREMDALLRFFQTRIGHFLANPDMASLARSLAEVEEVQDLLQTADPGLDVSWASSLRERLYVAEAKLIDNLSSPSQAVERQRLQDEMEKAHQQYNIPPHPSLSTIREKTRDVQAQATFQELEDRWSNALGAPERHSPNELVGDVDEFLSRYGNRLADRAQKLETDYLTAYERWARSEMKAAYDRLRQEPTERIYEELGRFIRDYDTELSPFRQDVAVLDTDSFLNDLKRALCVEIVTRHDDDLEVDTGGSFSSKCGIRRYWLLDGDLRVRVNWRPKNSKDRPKPDSYDLTLGQVCGRGVSIEKGKIRLECTYQWPPLEPQR